MQTQVEMEMRACVKCGRNFKVMVGSQQGVCSTACDRFGIQVPGAAQKASSVNGSNRETVSVPVTKGTRPTEPGKTFEARVGVWPTRKPQEKEQQNITNPTRGGSMQSELNGAETIRSVSLPPNAPTIIDEEKKMQPPSANAGTGETLPVLSADSQKSLEKAGLDSMTLLNRSANKLMKLMDGTVGSDEFDKAQEGVMKLDVGRTEVAINCANALAHTVQTQVNMVKAMSAFMVRK